MHVMIKRPAVSEEVVMDLRGRGVEVSSARLLDTRAVQSRICLRVWGGQGLVRSPCNDLFDGQ